MIKFIITILLATISSICNAKELKLVGTALAEFSIFKIDIYQVSYFRGPHDHEEIQLKYKRDIDKKYSIMGWEKGLSHLFKKDPIYVNKFQWISDQVVDLKKGDLYTIKKVQNTVSMLKNTTLLASIDDPIIASMVFEPWIGSPPVDKKLKDELLNSKGD
jgi:hypothetical protein